MRNFVLIETQTGIKIAGRNINNLRYADDTTLMAESEEELKSLFNFFFLKIQFIFHVDRSSQCDQFSACVIIYQNKFSHKTLFHQL